MYPAASEGRVSSLRQVFLQQRATIKHNPPWRTPASELHLMIELISWKALPFLPERGYASYRGR